MHDKIEHFAAITVIQNIFILQSKTKVRVPKCAFLIMNDFTYSLYMQWRHYLV